MKIKLFKIKWFKSLYAARMTVNLKFTKYPLISLRAEVEEGYVFLGIGIPFVLFWIEASPTGLEWWKAPYLMP